MVHVCNPGSEGSWGQKDFKFQASPGKVNEKANVKNKLKTK